MGYAPSVFFSKKCLDVLKNLLTLPFSCCVYSRSTVYISMSSSHNEGVCEHRIITLVDIYNNKNIPCYKGHWESSDLHLPWV